MARSAKTLAKIALTPHYLWCPLAFTSPPIKARSLGSWSRKVPSYFAFRYQATGMLVYKAQNEASPSCASTCFP